MSGATDGTNRTNETDGTHPLHSSHSSHSSHSRTALAAAFSLWGLAIAISLAPWWTRPAQPGQLPGWATSTNLDAHAPMRFILGLIVLPILLPLLLRPVLRRLEDARPWARNGAGWACVVALWSAAISRDPLWTMVPCALVVAACTFFRSFDARFTRHDVILIPAFATTWFGVIDVAPNLPVHHAVIAAALLVFAVRLAILRTTAHRPPPTPPALSFLLAPLGLLLQTSFFARDQRYLGWHALVLALVTPFVVRPLLRDPRRALRILALLIYPIAAFSYANASSISTAEGKPRVNFFEDSHFMLPASEILRGERLYRDVLPAHGMFEDGLFDYLAMKTRGVNLGEALQGRALIGHVNAIAIFALGFALTGSAEAGLLAFFLAAMFGTTGTGTIRITPAIFSLALIAGAVRRRDPRPLFFAGLGFVLCVMTSLDFAAYTLLALIFACVRARAYRHAIAGIATATIVLFAILALLGIADDFVTGTLFEVLTLGPAYAMSLFRAPEGFVMFSGVPEIVAALFHKSSFLHLIWIGAVVFLGVRLTRPRSRRYEPLVVLAVFIALCAISYAERHHLHWQFVAAPFLAGLAYLLPRGRAVAVVVLLMIAWPTTHIAITGWMRQSRGPIEAGWTEIAEIPRARGAHFTEADTAFVRGAKKYVDLTLAPDETYFDFANRGLLHFLLRRDAPIRQYEVAFYEPEERQRAVIAALERNPKVKAALIGKPLLVDGIPNETRAPLVWQYLQANFYPDFAEGDVVFWRRKAQ